jgi:transposase
MPSEIRHFAVGLQQDEMAVKVALNCEWSNGQVEGQVNPLKKIMRQMYGQGSFELLRKCGRANYRCSFSGEIA